MRRCGFGTGRCFKSKKRRALEIQSRGNSSRQRCEYLELQMSNKNNKFQTSEVEVAMVASIGTLPPVKIELSVDAAHAHTHNQQHLATDHLLPNLRQRTISSGHLTGIGTALWQYSYSALVGASVIQAAVRLVLTWLISRCGPRLPSRNVRTRQWLTFSANLTAGTLMSRCIALNLFSTVRDLKYSWGTHGCVSSACLKLA